jgi:hypothetical protein
VASRLLEEMPQALCPSQDEPKERRVSDKSAPEQCLPPSSAAESSLRDPTGALLSSPKVAPVAERHSESSDDSANFEKSLYDRDTEPSIDAQLLRNALHEALK